jgi:hypothetical protein
LDYDMSLPKRAWVAQKTRHKILKFKFNCNPY